MRKSLKVFNVIRMRREKRVRAKLRGTATRPRLSIFRSNRQTYAQLIDDNIQRTLASASLQEIKGRLKKSGAAEKLGELIAERALVAGVKEAVFDRGAYKYHGRVKAVAEGARKKGLKL
jgi:large subunit ribosomal protein L18